MEKIPGELIIDLIVSVIYQESFSSYAQVDTLLVKAPNGDDYEAEFSFLIRHTAKMLIPGRYLSN